MRSKGARQKRCGKFKFIKIHLASQQSPEFTDFIGSYCNYCYFLRQCLLCPDNVWELSLATAVLVFGVLVSREGQMRYLVLLLTERTVTFSSITFLPLLQHLLQHHGVLLA